METWSRFGEVEKTALAFFKAEIAYEHSGSPNSIKKLFSQHDRHLDYIILEGSLKADLLGLQIFSEEEADFLQTDPVGKLGFCQCAEFFMNGFKLGHTALGLSVHKYVVPIHSNKLFEPLSNSVVYYPKSYQKLYALASPIAKCFQNCFSIEGSKTSGITLWDVTYNGGGV